MESVLALVVSVLVLSFFGFVTFAYGLGILSAIKKSREPRVKAPGRRGWFN